MQRVSDYTVVESDVYDSYVPFLCFGLSAFGGS